MILNDFFPIYLCVKYQDNDSFNMVIKEIKVKYNKSLKVNAILLIGPHLFALRVILGIIEEIDSAVAEPGFIALGRGKILIFCPLIILFFPL